MKQATPCPTCREPRELRQYKSGPKAVCNPCATARRKKARRAKGVEAPKRVPTDRKAGDPAGPCPHCGGETTWYSPSGRDTWERRCVTCRRGHYAENKDQYKRNYDRWRKENPERLRTIRSRYRSAVVNAPSDGLPVRLSPNAKCYICLGAPVEHIDHVVPLAQGGSDRVSNKAGACKACNTAKGARVWPGHPGWDDFLEKRRKF